MDLLERYLQAVGKYLPEQTSGDVLAELRANLLEQMDARAEEIRRPLAEDDIAAILRAHGKPELVAARYLPQRSLIGPAIFPFYTLTLTRVLPLVVFISAIVQGIEFVSVPHESVAHALGTFAAGLWSSLLMTAAIVTAIFAGIEWARERGKLDANWNTWDPARLPPVRAHGMDARTPRSMAKHILDLTLHCLWMAFVLWVPWHPFWIMGPGILLMNQLDVRFAPVWHVFYAVLLTLLTVQLAMKLLAVAGKRGRWQAPLKLTTQLLGVVAIGVLASSSLYFLPGAGAADPQKLALVNHSTGLAIRIVFVIALAGLIGDGWKLLRHRRQAQRMAF